MREWVASLIDMARTNLAGDTAPQVTLRPTRKVSASWLAGLLTILVYTAAAEWFDVSLDAEVVGWIVGGLMGFAGYFVEELRS